MFWSNLINWRHILLTSYISRSRRDRWGTTEDLTANFLHPSLSSASIKASPSFRPVHSRMLSSHLFLCLPLSLSPCNVPCKIVLARPFDLTTCPYHFSLRFSLWSGGHQKARWIVEFVFLLPALVNDVVFVRDAEECAKASHLCGLYPLF